MNCIVVDDEPIALSGMSDFVRKTPFLKLIASCKNALEAVQAITENQVDLIFLDINMPMLSGLEMIQTIDRPPMVIFATAYPDYALKGFELNAVDYLLKPISYSKFLKASQKAYKTFHLTQQPESPNNEEYIYIKVDKKLIKVKINDITYIEALKDYIQIHTKEHSYITYLSLNKIIEHLPDSNFAQVHKSYIIATDAVEAIDGSFLEIGKKAIPIGRAFKEKVFLKIINNKLLKK